MTEKKFSILYVDDEDSNLRIFRNTFRREYKVYTATSAKEGIKILENEKIDIILSDQRMPEMTGVDFLKYALKEHPELNRILITGYTDFSAIKNAINDAKIYQYVQKPWREDDLSSTIKEALKIYQLEIENKELTEVLKKANEKLQIEKEKAEESSRLKTVFLANMSHEIRTPMNGIIGFSTFLKEDKVSDEKRKEFADFIIRSAERLMKIIENILEFSKFETKQVECKEVITDLIIVFGNIFEKFNSLAKAKKINFNVNYNFSDSDTVVITDPTLLKFILENLTENAIKYTEKGSVNINVDVLDNILKIEIIDTGEGIDTAMHNKIYEPFRRGENIEDRITDGLGLGLSIVKESINILGGKLDLISEKGKGTTFICEIPVKKSDA